MVRISPSTRKYSPFPAKIYLYFGFHAGKLYPFPCYSIGNYEDREYYHIITNSNGDSLITEDDADEIFDSLRKRGLRVFRGLEIAMDFSGAISRCI